MNKFKKPSLLIVMAVFFVIAVSGCSKSKELLTPNEIVNRISDSVVHIVATKDLPVYKDKPYYFSFKDYLENPLNDGIVTDSDLQISGGMGLMFDKDGFVLTNSHVVNNKDDFKVVMKNGDEYDAKIVSINSDNDLAVLQIQSGKFPFFKISKSNDISIGSDVILINKDYEYTLCKITEVDKSITVENKELDNLIGIDQVGVSGSVVLDMHGDLVGIVAINDTVNNMSYLIGAGEILESIKN